MADNSVITSEQVISPTVFTPTIEQATLLEVKLNQLIGSFETLATITGKKLGSTADPKTIKDLQEQKEAIDNINQAQKAQIETEKIRVKTNELGATLRKKELSDWDDLTQRLNVATRSYKEIAAAQGVGSKAAVDAALAVNKLKDEQTGINRAIGNYSDQVGNYSGALQNYVITLRGLRGPVKLLGEALGIGAYEADNIRLALEHSLQGYAAYQRGLGGTTTALNANTLATEENTVAKEENAEVTAASTTVWQKLVSALGTGGIWVAITAAVAALGLTIYAFIKSIQQARAEQKLLNEIDEEAAKTYFKEQDAIKELILTIGDLNAANDDRFKSLNKLKEQFPDLLRNANLQNISDEKYADIIKNKINPALEARAKVQATLGKIAEAQQKVRTIQDEGVSFFEKLTAGANEREANDPITKAATATDLFNAAVKEAQRPLVLLNKELAIFTKEADKISSNDNLLTALKEIEKGFEAIQIGTSKSTSAQFGAKKSVLDSQFSVDINKIGLTPNEKAVVIAKYKKDLTDIDHDINIFTLQNNKANSEIKLSFLNISNQAQLDAKTKLIRDNEALDIEEAKRAQKSAQEIALIHAHADAEIVTAELEFQKKQREISDEDKSVLAEGIKDNYDRQIEQEKLSLQKKLDAIKGFSDEENKLRADLIKQSQQKLDDLTTQKGLHQAKNITDATVSNTTPGTQANYSARIADLKAEEAIELQLVEANESAKAAIVAKYEKQIRDIQHQSNIEAHQDAIDNYDAQIILLKLKGDSFANLDKIRTAERLKAKEEEDKAIAEANGDPDKILLAQANYAKAIFDIDKQIADEKIAQAQRASDAIVKITEDRIAIEQAANKEALDKYATQIQQQTQLAVAGKANTLAYLERQQAAAYVRQAQLDKQAAKVKEGQELANIFLAFMKVNAGKGLAAAPESLAETLVAKGIGEALASFYVGTEDTGPGGNLDSKGGMLAVLHPNERVLTAEQNSKLGKVSNEQLVNSFIKLNYYPAIKDISPREEMSNAMAEMLHKDMEKLTETIKNKREQAIDWNSLNEMVIRQTENGLTRETTHKNSTFIISKRTFN